MMRGLGGRSVTYGVVVDSVNVSDLAYVPERSASPALMCCWNAIVTASLEVGAVQDFSSVGAAEPPTSANEPPALACSVVGSENVPLTRWPVAVLDGSATLSAASPAEEI